MGQRTYLMHTRFID